MINLLLLQVKQHWKRHYVRVMAFVVVGILAISLAYTATTHQKNRVEPVLTEIATSGFARSAPVHLRIPELTIDTTFVAPLGLNEDQTIAVPDSYEQVGWYRGGATPGEVGPAVILGHVDSASGPAVFYSLGQLAIGDEIIITRDDESTAVFVVEALERYPQSEFPTLAVYGPTDYPALRLVTCSGLFDKSAQRYSHNLVVYARLRE